MHIDLSLMTDRIVSPGRRICGLIGRIFSPATKTIRSSVHFVYRYARATNRLRPVVDNLLFMSRRPRRVRQHFSSSQFARIPAQQLRYTSVSIPRFEIISMLMDAALHRSSLNATSPSPVLGYFVLGILMVLKHDIITL